MSKYWRKTKMADYSALFKGWRTDIANAPMDGTWFMGRITGTNRAKAICYNDETQRWMTKDEGAVSICQWLTFYDYADIRACAWRQT